MNLLKPRPLGLGIAAGASCRGHPPNCSASNVCQFRIRRCASIVELTSQQDSRRR
ncbi:hypothetical protein FKP32DRAFT_1598334 [Trametes sanguinea]|nr:hypothetical protein FKP32DRAFT_1598334 [Trametes sanguinea]